MGQSQVSGQKQRMLHTMIRVGDLQRSIDFYTEKLGMTLLRTWDVPDEEYTLAFLGYGTEMETTVLELTYNYGKSKYDHGSAYGHICIGIEDVKRATKFLKENNVEVTYESDDGFMAFLEDPDGYSIELLNEKMMMEKAQKDYDEQRIKGRNAVKAAKKEETATQE